MITVKIKLRPSTVLGNPGSFYFQVRCQVNYFQLTTVYKAFPEEWDARNREILFSNSSRVGLLQEIARHLQRDYVVLCDAVERMHTSLSGLPPSEVRKLLEGVLSSDNFFFYLNARILVLRENRKFGTARNYESARKSFSEFLGKENLPFSLLTERLISRYEGWLEGRKVSRNTVSFYMRILRSVYNRLANEGLVSQSFPFRKVYTGVERTRKRAVNELTIAKFRGVDLTAFPALSYTRDIFFLVCIPAGWLLSMWLI